MLHIPSSTNAGQCSAADSFEVVAMVVNALQWQCDNERPPFFRHHHHLVGDVLHHRQIVPDEDVAHPVCECPDSLLDEIDFGGIPLPKLDSNAGHDMKHQVESLA